MDEAPVYSQQNQLLMNYKKHRSYVLFISSLRAEYTKIKYDGCLKKYLRSPVNCNPFEYGPNTKKGPENHRDGVNSYVNDKIHSSVN